MIGRIALLAAWLFPFAAGCTEPAAASDLPPHPITSASTSSQSAAGLPSHDTVSTASAQQSACEADEAALGTAISEGKEKVFPGTPALDRQRAEILGRARGEPVIFVREPAWVDEASLAPELVASRRLFEKEPPGPRISRLKRRHASDKPTLRRMMLREGYVYSADPQDALALVTDLRIIDLFDEPEIWLHRATEIHRLTRVKPARGDAEYRYADGPREGRSVDLLWGDRFVVTRDDLSEPLHRDLLAVSDDQGFDRMKIERITSGVVLASVRYGQRFVKARFTSEGAKLSLACLLESPQMRDEIAAWRASDAIRRDAMARVHETVTLQVDESFRFDRPEGVTNAEKDGQLRPGWLDAYRHGRAYFSHEDHSYPVYDPQGRAWPPEVCVDLVLDTFERASGSWYRPKHEAPSRVIGGLDFDAYAIPNRRAVLAFEQFARSQPDLFDSRRFEGAERIPFGERARFFTWLVEHADEVRAGDIVAIHGRKRDGLIHQHAIFVERIDPISGFAYGLADQMKRPRRRTWDGIMAEAPLRSLLYRVRPKPVIWEKIAAPLPTAPAP